MADPKIPRMKDLPRDLEQVNSVLQDITTKLANIGGAMRETFKIDGQAINTFSELNKKLTERAKKTKELDKLARKQRVDISETMAAQEKAAKKVNDAEKKLNKLLDQQAKYLAKTGNSSKRLAMLIDKQQKKTKSLVDAEKTVNDKLENQSKELRDIERQVEQTQKKWDLIGAYLGNKLLGAIDAIGKSIAAFAIDAVVSGVDTLKKGFLAVYDLVERQVKAIGTFNEQVGTGTKALHQLQQEGWELEGALRSIDDAELGIGLKELASSTQAFGFADKNLKEFRKDAVLAGRALGVGVDAAGELARTWHLMAGDKPASMFTDIEDAANAANVPVAKFAKEIAGSKNFMAAFGKAGEKAFLRTAAFANKLGVSLQSLQAFTDITDTFEGAAESAAKLNSTFGTSINALDLMLEQDPGKRLEAIRKQLFAQGRDVQNMSRQEVKFLGQTIGLNEEETEAILKRGITLDQFYAEQKKKKDDQVKDEERLRKGLLATVKTLEPWKMLFDDLTRAFMPFVRQFTDFLGITHRAGDKDFVPFAKRVQQVAENIKELFGVLQDNGDVKAFVSDVFGAFKGIFNVVGGKGKDTKKTMQQISEAVGSVARFGKEAFDVMKKGFGFVWDHREGILDVFKFVVDHADTLLAVWGGGKVISGITTAAGGIGNIVKLTAQLGRGFGGLIGALGTGVGSAGAGTLIGAVGIAAAAGWEFGTKLREWFPIIDKTAQKLLDGVTSFFDDLWKKIVHTTFYKSIFGSEAAEAYDRADAQEAAYQAALRKDEQRKASRAATAPITHLQPPAAATVRNQGAATSGSTNLAAKKPAAKKPAAVINNTIKLKGKELGNVVTEVQMDSAAGAEDY